MPSRDQLPKRLRDSLARMESAKNAGSFVTPDYDKIRTAYQPETADDDGGGVSWGSIGGAILKSLSVPQAALGTALYKGGKALPWARGDDTISWGAALGDFHRDEEGRTGWQEIAEEGLGLDRKGGFALGLLADPLWAAGIVSKPAAIASDIGTAGRAAKAATKATSGPGAALERVARPVPRGTGSGTAVVRAAHTPSGNWTSVIDKIRPAKDADVVRLYRGERSRPVPSRPGREGDLKYDEFPFPERWAEARRGRWFTADPEYARAYAGKNGRVLYVDVPKSRLDEVTSVPAHRLEDAEFVLPDEFLQRAKQLGGRRKSARNRPDRSPGTQVLLSRFKGQPNTAGWSAVLKKFDDTPVLSPLGPLPRAAEQAVKAATGAAAKEGNIRWTRFGPVLKNVMASSKNTTAFAKRKVGGQNEVFLRLGFGEKFSKDIKLGTTKARIFNNTKTFGQLGRSPLERAGHQVKVSNDEVTQIALKWLDNVAKNWKKELGLSDEAASAAAQRVGTVAIAANESPKMAAALRASFSADGLWSREYDLLLGHLRKHWDEFAAELGMSTGKRPGPYAPQKMANETTEEFAQRYREMVERGEVPSGVSSGGGGPNPLEGRAFQSSFAAMTTDEGVEHLVRLGMDRGAAEDWVKAWNEGVDEASRFADEATGFKPEFDMFELAKWREKGQMKVIVDRQIEELAEQAGVFNKTVIEDLKNSNLGGPLTKSSAGRLALTFIGAFKTILTTVNPSHYVRNVTGDYVNHLINGNFRHIGTSAWSSRSPYWRMSRATKDEDFAALKGTYKIGDQEYSGAELLVESAFMGLGRGYVGSDIAQMMDMLQSGIHNKPFFKQMTRMNMNRENAVRLETYIKHRRGGDDMMTAAAKTLRVHFDYSDLTEIEKLFMRNLFMFYTWLRRNTVLQVTGVLSRPGLYSAARTMEQYRPKLEGEPGYLSDLMMVGAPGLGSWNVGNPMEALNRLEPTGENFRQTVLGAVNPLARVPVELGTNRNWRTGYDISRGPGDVQPGLTPSLLAALGVDLPQASFTGSTPPGPAMDPGWKHAIENLLLVGPQASSVAAMTRPQDEYAPDAGWRGWVERFAGVRQHRPDASQAARGIAAKIREAERKISVARKYKVQP